MVALRAYEVNVRPAQKVSPVMLSPWRTLGGARAGASADSLYPARACWSRGESGR